MCRYCDPVKPPFLIKVSATVVPMLFRGVVENEYVTAVLMDTVKTKSVYNKNLSKM